MSNPMISSGTAIDSPPTSFQPALRRPSPAATGQTEHTGRRTLAATVLKKSASIEPHVCIDEINDQYIKDASRTLSLDQVIELVSSEDPSTLDSQYYIVVRQDHDEAARKYMKLQQLLAAKIPEECHRPIIDIKFVFGHPTNSYQVLGVLGGVGPIADADLAMRMVSGLLKAGCQDRMVHILSMPPPRNWSDIACNGISYFARLSWFLTHGYAQYAVASNTAHLNLDNMRAITGSGSVFLNLVEDVAKQIQHDRIDRRSMDPVLMSGTIAAYEGRLYDQALAHQAIHTARCTRDEIQKIDEVIQDVKKAQKDSNLVADRLSQLLFEYGRSYQTKTMLLGCTELSLALKPAIEQMRHLGYVIYDSQQMFADSLTQRLIGAQAESTS